MSESKPPPAPGTVMWTDLTVPDAGRLRDFYAMVVGWQPAEVDMGGYSDFNMNLPATGEAAAGICFARGVNANLPAQWLIYIVVSDLDESLANCRALGGKIIRGPHGEQGQGRLAVIQDPAGAVAALIELTPGGSPA